MIKKRRRAIGWKAKHTYVEAKAILKLEKIKRRRRYVGLCNRHSALPIKFVAKRHIWSWLTKNTSSKHF